MIETQHIEDVLNVSGILSSHHEEDAAHSPTLIADLIDWADSRHEHVHVATADAVITEDEARVAAINSPKPKGKAGKATESDDSDDKFTATPDPSDEPDF